MSRLRILCALCFALLCLPAAARAAGPPPGFVPYAPDSVWNLRLRDDAPLAPRSAAWVGYLRGLVAKHGTWVNTTTCGMPLFWADAGTPTLPVRLVDHAADAGLSRAWTAVPIPAEARPASCGDKNLSVAQVQPDGSVRSWELYKAVRAADGSWTANWGGATADLRGDRGFGSALAWSDGGTLRSRPWWNVTATSASMNAGVITDADLAAGRIDHALALATNDAAKGVWSWPAQRTDGTDTASDAIPEGAHLRIDPDVDLAAIPMSPGVRMMAEAAQRYGIVLRDKTYSANVFYSTPDAHARLRGLLNGKNPSAALAAFPWQRLLVLAAPTCVQSPCVRSTAGVLDVDDAAPSAGQAVSFDTTASALDQPRTAVAWDLDGDGTYETDGGTAVKRSVVVRGVGARTVGVRMTTADGRVTTAARTLDVRPARERR